MFTASVGLISTLPLYYTYFPLFVCPLGCFCSYISMYTHQNASFAPFGYYYFRFLCNVVSVIVIMLYTK